MKKFILKLFKPFLKGIAIKEIENEKYRSLISEKINAKIDIPNITEKEEAEYIDIIYDVVQIMLVDIVEDI